MAFIDRYKPFQFDGQRYRPICMAFATSTAYRDEWICWKDGICSRIVSWLYEKSETPRFKLFCLEAKLWKVQPGQVMPRYTLGHLLFRIDCLLQRTGIRIDRDLIR